MSTVHVHAAIVLARPVADVWKVVADLEPDLLRRAQVCTIARETIPWS